jgi:hypothetical protein
MEHRQGALYGLGRFFQLVQLRFRCSGRGAQRRLALRHRLHTLVLRIDPVLDIVRALPVLIELGSLTGHLREDDCREPDGSYCRNDSQRHQRNRQARREADPDAEAIRMNILSPESEQVYFASCLWMDKAAVFIPSNGQESYLDLHDFGRLMLQQGCRPEEFLELRKVDVDLLNRWLYIRTGKTRAARRRLKLTAESAAILKRRLSSQIGPFVFPSPGNPQAHRCPTWRVHAEVLAACGLLFVPYDFRHTFATRAAADGMPMPVLAAALGHANLRSVMKYIHISGADIDAETVRIDGIRTARVLDEQRRNSLAGFLPGTPSGKAPEAEKQVVRGGAGKTNEAV